MADTIPSLSPHLSGLEQHPHLLQSLSQPKDPEPSLSKNRGPHYSVIFHLDRVYYILPFPWVGKFALGSATHPPPPPPLLHTHPAQTTLPVFPGFCIGQGLRLEHPFYHALCLANISCLEVGPFLGMPSLHTKYHAVHPLWDEMTVEAKIALLAFMKQI